MKLIFDFDGTMARSHGPVYDVMKQLIERRGVTMPTPEEMRELGTRDALKRLRVPNWYVPWFTMRARRLLRERMREVELEPGMDELLRDGHRAGYRMGLVSSNSRANVFSVLERARVADCFEHCVFGSSLLGKKRSLAKMATLMKAEPKEILSIGDETRDLDAATALGMPSIAVGWGFHSILKLAECRPRYLAESVDDLRRILGL